MPGRKSYGPAGKWVHDRAERIMRRGDTKDQYGKKKGKSVAYAIAVQQAHKLGKSPKKFRTPTGVRVAKRKFDMPKKEYQKTAAGAGAATVGRGLRGAVLGPQVSLMTDRTPPEVMMEAAKRPEPRTGRRIGALVGGLGGAAALALARKSPLGPIPRTLIGGLGGAGLGALVGGGVGQTLAEERVKRAMVSAFFEELEQIKLAQGGDGGEARAASANAATQSNRSLVTTGGTGEGEGSGSGSQATAGASPGLTGRGTGGATGNLGTTSNEAAAPARDTAAGLDIPSPNIGNIPGGAPGGGGIGTVPGGGDPTGGGSQGMPGEMSPVKGIGGGETSPGGTAAPVGGNMQERLAKGVPGQLQ